MIFASGLVLAAVAVTAANAGNPSNLRTTDESTKTNGDNSLFLARSPSGSEDIDPDDLTIDLTEILGESTDGSHIKLNILDLIGSGSDQVDIEDILEAFKDQSGDGDLSFLDGFDEKDGSQEHHHHEKENIGDNNVSDKDLIWINNLVNENAGSKDTAATKGAIVGAAVKGDVDDDSSNDDSTSGNTDPFAAKAATKGGLPTGKNQGSGGDNMAWLFEDDGSVDPTATKGGAAFLTNDDAVASKGGKGAGVYKDDLTSGSTDPVATKATKASKKGAAGFPIPVDLFNDGSNSDIDEAVVEDNNHSFMFGGATKGSSPAVEDDGNSKTEDDVLGQNKVVQSDNVDPVATKATK